MEEFSVRIVMAGDRAFVCPAGELDLAAAREMENAVDSAVDGHKQLVIDLREVTFLDTEGVKSLLRAARVAAEHDIALRVVPGRRSVERVFDLTDTRSRLDFVDPSTEDLESAESAVR
jgi:anti-sigma B factor antagonist